jgi:mannose-6-phosphate isomerase
MVSPATGAATGPSGDWLFLWKEACSFLKKRTKKLLQMDLHTLRAWLLTQAIPLWLRHGVHDGFHEALAADTYACDTPFRRLRVLARQIHVFSHAHRAGVPSAAEAAALGIDILTRHAALPEGGYAWRFDLTNRPTDTTRDLYDHAFVLLAFASATNVLPPPPLRRHALDLLTFLDTHMAHPIAGYVESLPPVLPRRQNPHMHLLEALLAAHTAFGEPIFLDRAHTLVTLFLTRLLDPATGALPEFFDDALRPDPVDAFTTEPGHHCEWAWLLYDYARQSHPNPHLGLSLTHAAARLLAFADTNGTHPATGDLIDAVAADGTPLARSARLWPQTERLKSAHLRPDSTRAHRARAIANLAAYLRPDGLWHERRDAAGTFLPGPAPASSLYHLTTAILTVAP